MEEVVGFYQQYHRALLKLQAAMYLYRTQHSTFVFDSVLFRFLKTVDLNLEMLRVSVAYQGVVFYDTPRDIIEQAYYLRIVLKRDVYFHMLESYKVLFYSHDEDDCMMVYQKLDQHYIQLLKSIDEQMKLYIKLLEDRGKRE